MVPLGELNDDANVVTSLSPEVELIRGIQAGDVDAVGDVNGELLRIPEVELQQELLNLNENFYEVRFGRFCNCCLIRESLPGSIICLECREFGRPREECEVPHTRREQRATRREQRAWQPSWCTIYNLMVDICYACI